MPNQVIIFLFSLVGIFLFIKEFKKLKGYFSVYAELFGIVTILYLIILIVGFVFFNLQLEFYVVFMIIVGIIRNTMVASLATFYLKNELNIVAAPFIFKSNLDKTSIVKNTKYSLFILTVIIILAITFILLSGNKIFYLRDFSWDVGIYTIFNSFLISFSEEMFVRLYMFGIVAYWLRKIRGNFVIAAVLSSFLWSLDHFLVDVMIMKFLFLFIMGLLLSMLMYRKGIESCIVVHGLYNSLAFLILGYMK